MHDRTFIVTGAAGALGRAAVAVFREGGARLVLIDRELSLLHAAFPDLGNDPRCLSIAADVTDRASMQHAVGVAIQDFGRIDALVHIAGGFTMGEGVHELMRESWDGMMNLNAWSFVACSHAVVPHMMAAGRGHIIAISARSAVRGEAKMGAYIAAKSALQRLVESLSAEVREHGISVNSVAPSIIDTPANRAGMPDADPARWVSPSTLARTLVFLTSEAGAAIHGQHLVVSGLS
jgi:NAD(P)-dependent dehydrogenase (short-subunit alcohol dehydrogenase family)